MAEQEMIVKYIRNDDGTFNIKYICEVVRCGFCKWNGRCYQQRDDAWFCADGERWEQDDS